MSHQTLHPRRRVFLKQTAFLGAATQAALIPAKAQTAPGPIAETNYGRVRGITENGVHRFLGIHYGGDTSGKNRFQPPTKPASWTGVRDALQWGSVAPQALPTGGWDYTYAVQWANQPGGQSEDCLVLNVWTPGLADGGKRPVLFSIHGGGYATGTSGNPAFNGQPLAKYGNVVVVTINHRLGSLGYLHLGGMVPEWSASAEAGMLDIVAALEWVRDNIERFGGDPANVMIYGQSGGGGKVCHLMTMPSAKGLFHKAAIQSGSTLRSGDPAAAAETADKMLTQIGIGKTRVRELQSIPWQMMIGAQMSVGGRLGPILDGKIVPRHPFDPDASPLSANVPLIVGTTLHDSAPRGGGPEMDEAAMMAQAKQMLGADADRIIRAYRQAFPNERPALLLGRLSTDRGGRRSAIALSERKAAANRAPVYAYRFDLPSVVHGGRYGAVHGVDVPASFRNPASWPLTGDGADAKAVADKFSAAWVAFAKTGDPTAGGLKWPPYNTTTRATMLFDRETRVVNDPDVELLKLIGTRT